MVTKKVGRFPKQMDFGPKNCIFGPKFCIFLRYTYETPIFWGQTNPTQCDHKSPISWGNSGYLPFHGQWSFGRLMGCFLDPHWQKTWPRQELRRNGRVFTFCQIAGNMPKIRFFFFKKQPKSTKRLIFNWEKATFFFAQLCPVVARA